MEINNKYINKILDSKQKSKQSKFHLMMTKVAAIQHSFTTTMWSLRYGKFNSYLIRSWMQSKESKLQSWELIVKVSPKIGQCSSFKFITQIKALLLIYKLWIRSTTVLERWWNPTRSWKFSMIFVRMPPHWYASTILSVISFLTHK